MDRAVQSSLPILCHGQSGSAKCVVWSTKHSGAWRCTWGNSTATIPGSGVSCVAGASPWRTTMRATWTCTTESKPSSAPTVPKPSHIRPACELTWKLVPAVGNRRVNNFSPPNGCSWHGEVCAGRGPVCRTTVLPGHSNTVVLYFCGKIQFSVFK